MLAAPLAMEPPALVADQVAAAVILRLPLKTPYSDSGAAPFDCKRQSLAAFILTTATGSQAFCKNDYLLQSSKEGTRDEKHSGFTKKSTK